MSDALPFPRAMTPEIAEVLGLFPWQHRATADSLEKAGAPIPRDPPSRHAYVTHWLITIAIEAGEYWQDAARLKLDEMAERARKSPNPRA